MRLNETLKNSRLYRTYIWMWNKYLITRTKAICTVSYGYYYVITILVQMIAVTVHVHMYPYLWLNHACNRDKYNPQDMLFIWDIVVSGDLITSFKKTHLVNEKHEWFFHSLQIWPQTIVSEKELFNLTCYPKYIQTLE